MCRRNRGFTVVELLVALSVIAVLLAITLPAIQAARESSRRVECESRLKQFGVAIHSYEGIHGALPPAQRAVPKSPFHFSAHYYSPHVYLLPYFEQTALANSINTQQENNYEWDPAALPSSARTPVTAFLCPSDGGASGNNYRFCLGVGANETGAPFLIGADGPFTIIFPNRTAAIRDGLSHTMAVSEKRKSSGSATVFDAEEDYWHTGILNVQPKIPAVDEMVALCASLTGDPPEYQPHAGGTWFIAAYDYTWYNHAMTPNRPIPDCSAQSFSATAKPGDGAYKASSQHRGGVNCVFLDGHTKFISDSIDLRIWRALATRAGDPRGRGAAERRRLLTSHQ